MTQYSIKDLENLSGIKAHTIRIWERRYQLLDPERTATNIRYYSNDDLRRILNIALLVKNGHKISNVATYDIAKLQSEVIRQNKNLIDPEKNIDQLLLYTVNLDILGFEQLLNKIILENGFSKTIEHVIFPFFERIGILWQAGTIFVAQEHFVSNLIRNHLIIEAAKFDNQSSKQTMLFFLHEDEMHELGLLYFSYLAAKNGFRSAYLGQNVPFDDLANLVRNNQFDFICTTFIQAIEKPALEKYLTNLSLISPENKILVAGRQIAIHRPKLPGNIFVIKNNHDFAKRLRPQADS